MYQITRIVLLFAVATTCFSAPNQHRLIETREFEQQFPEPDDTAVSVSGSGSRMHRILTAGLKPFQRVSTGALSIVCSAITPATAVSNFVQSYVLGVLIWVLGWASTVTTFLPPIHVPLSGVQVGLNMGRTVLSTVTFVASNYGCTVTNGLTGAINFVVNTMTRII